MMSVVYALAFIQAWAILSSAWIYFRGDRSGNSGRAGHWSSNPRIVGADKRRA